MTSAVPGAWPYVGTALAAAEPAQLLPARQQMAFTLAFHIVLVPFGVAFTAMMLIANYRGIRRDDGDSLVLARRWSKVAAVLFAVGAVSGTVLSFEMGLLWPRLMDRFGAGTASRSRSRGSSSSWRPSSWPSTSTAGGAFVPGHTC